MANTIKSTGTVTLATPAVSIRQSVLVDYVMSGSNLVYEAKNIAVGSWQALTTSSLSEMRYGVFYNGILSSSIIIARDSAGTYQVAGLLYDETAVIPFSSSIGGGSLYARAYNSASVLEYTLAEF